MKKHFENLWEDAENISNDTSDEAIKEFLLKANLLNNNLDQASFNYLYGEILFAMAKISKSKNINVFKELNTIIKSKVI